MEHEHVQEIGQFPNGIHDKNSYEDIDSNRSLDQFVDIIQKNGNKEDINKIDDSKIPKFKFIQGCAVLVNLTKYT
jgi:hypothetical protein